jgi:hypothetical protein
MINITIQDYLTWLCQPAYNIRAIYKDCRKNFWTADAEEAADQALAYSNDGAVGVYVNIHDTKPNYAEVHGEQSQGVKNASIAGVSTLLIDLDVTDTSYRANANKAALRVADHFTTMGWPQPWVLDSGNGAACLWRVDLPIDTTLPGRIAQHIATLDLLPEGVEVDFSVYDLARIYRVPGTMNRKHDEVPAVTMARGSTDLVTLGQLTAVVGPEDATRHKPSKWLRRWLGST